MVYKTLIFLFLNSFGNFIFAQGSIVAAGQILEKQDELSISYSIGQIATSSGISSNSVINEGVHQVYIEKGLSSRIENDKYGDYNLFPNPTQGNLTLRFEGDNPVGTDYSIFSSDGSLMVRSHITSPRTFIKFEGNSGIYFLNIYDENEFITVFRIIKFN